MTVPLLRDGSLAEYKMLIGGEWRLSSNEAALTTVNPYTGRHGQRRPTPATRMWMRP